MSDLSINIKDDRISFLPQEKVEGHINWQVDQAPQSVILRLFWHTTGRGTTDVQIVDEMVLQDEECGGSAAFTLQLPESPYSFSGQLISLIWSLELIVEPGNHVEIQNLVMSSTCEEVQIASN